MAARISRRFISSQAEKVCGWDGEHSGLTVWTCWTSLHKNWKCT